MIRMKPQFALLFAIKVIISCVELANTQHSCNFDHGLCSGWQQSSQDSFDWTNQYGSTPTSSTGPHNDHGGYGRYMYIETSSPRQKGDNARLEYSLPVSYTGKSSCLTFYYHMYGYGIHTLNVFNGNTTVFTKSGNQGNQWFMAKITLTIQSKVTFEGISGRDSRGDIAIDDFFLSTGICQGYSKNVNQSFGTLDIRYSSEFDPYCNWIIERTDKTLTVAIVSINQVYFYSSSEYVKIYDGNEKEVFRLAGLDSSSNKNIGEVVFGGSKNITIQVYLVSSMSYVKVNYVTLKQGLNSASTLADWNVSIANISTNSIGIMWSHPTNLLNSKVRFYIALARKLGGNSVSAGEMALANETTSKIMYLEAYTEYNVCGVVVDVNGTLLKSSNILVMADEGVPSKAPHGLQVKSVEFTPNLVVQWSPLSQYYANGKILGYTIYYKENNDRSPFKSVDTKSPSSTRFELKGLTPGQHYVVSVAAFTSKGVGPRSEETFAAIGQFIIFNDSFGDIDFTITTGDGIRCKWTLQNSLVREAVALVFVQAINLRSWRDYVKITDGNSAEVLFHKGSLIAHGRGSRPFAPEILTDVTFGASNNISVEVETPPLQFGTKNYRIKIKFSILKKGLKSAILVMRWNITMVKADSTGVTLQWARLDEIVDLLIKFYIIEIKSVEDILLAVEIVPGGTNTTEITTLRASTKYRFAVYGVDDTGQPYKSLQVVVSTSKASCGVRPPGITTQTLGSTVANVNSWPWQAMVMNELKFCGGSLVDPYWVVTAAYCVYGSSPSSVKIRLGAHYSNKNKIGTEQDIGVVQIVVHDSYDYSRKHNIALLKLKSPAHLGVGVGLVCLPEATYQLPIHNNNKQCWITGWNRLTSVGSSTNSLMQASLPLVSKKRCKTAYPGKIDDSMLCAGFDEGGVRSCQGDVGGPLVCEFNGTWYLEGVTNWGSTCSQVGKCNVYTKVRNFKLWLLESMYGVVVPLVPPTVSPQNQSSSALVCNFDNGLCSGWSQSLSDDFDWTLVSGSTPSSSTGPSSGQGGSGNYMYIETSSPRRRGENAKLLVAVPNSGKQSCLSFYLHMYGTSVGTLIVYNGNETIFNASGNHGNHWMVVNRNVYLDREIIFEGITGSSYSGDVAIDQVQINEGSCTVSCSFETGLCPGWKQAKSDVFDWSDEKNPSRGKYMRLETSSWSIGDNAKLQVTLPKVKSPSCLTFYYYLFGYPKGTLNVYNGNVKIFSKSEYYGYTWTKVKRTLHLSNLLTFEGIVGTSGSGDIGLDDVTVTEGYCPGCGAVLNESFGELDIFNLEGLDQSYCNWTIGAGGLKRAVALISLQRTNLVSSSDSIKIFDSNGTEVYDDRQSLSKTPGLSIEIPFVEGRNITLAILLSHRRSNARVQYIILNHALRSSERVPSWDITVTNTTSSSLTLKWSKFPLSSTPIQQFLVKYREHGLNISLVFQVPNSYNTHDTGDILKPYRLYDVQVFAVTTIPGNGTFSSQTESTRTDENVPIFSPRIVRLSNTPLNAVMVRWIYYYHHLNIGKLLGYTVYFQKTSSGLIETVNISSPDIKMVILRGLEPAQSYRISVAAFTLKGASPQSKKKYITTGCGGYESQPFGHLYVGVNRGLTNSSCHWVIGSLNISEAVVFVLIKDLHPDRPYNSFENLKIINGNGSVVLDQYGYSSAPQPTILEVAFGKADNITVHLYLHSRYSQFKILYGIMKPGIQSASLISNWNVTVGETTTTSIAVHWQDITAVINKRILYHIILISKSNGNDARIVNEKTTYANITGISPYTDYQVSLVGVTSDGQPYKSSNITARTEEGKPSRGPSNIQYLKLRPGEVKVQWNNLPQQYANGRILGYSVYVDEQDYWSYTRIKTVNTSSPDAHIVILRGLKEAQVYRISAAAFTARGVGPKSTDLYVTTDCGKSLNESFGDLQVGRRPSSYPHNLFRCNWTISNPGISEAVLLIPYENFELYFNSDYIKISDGDGFATIYRSSSSARKVFLEVKFGSAKNVTVESFLTWRSSRLKLRYGILRQGLQSAWLVANWSVFIIKTTQRSVEIGWQNLTPILNQPVLYYFVLIKNAGSNGSLINGVVVSRDTRSVALGPYYYLLPYHDYLLIVYGVSDNGQAYKREVTVKTEEGVPSKGPSGIHFTNVTSTSITVNWDPLSERYANGRLLGYRVHLKQRYVLSKESRVSVANPGSTRVTFTGLKPKQYYDIYVSAFTSKGEGPRRNNIIATGCVVTLNQSFGLIDEHDYHDRLYCSWTIGNIGFAEAVAIFLIQDLHLSHCGDTVEILDDRYNVKFVQRGCSPSSPSILEVPFAKSSTIRFKTNIDEPSVVKVQFMVLNSSLDSAITLPGWTATVDETTSTSISIKWANLTSLLNNHVLRYIIILNRTNGNALGHAITEGNKLNSEISGLENSTHYRVEVFGVDEMQRVYRAFELIAITRKAVSCGSRPIISRIFGVAPVNSWPWQVVLLTNNGYTVFCAGSLIDPLWIVTTASCVDRRSAPYVKVMLAAHYYTADNPIGMEKTFEVVKIIKHENFSWFHKRNDIALLQLAKPAKLSKGVGLVCLPDKKFRMPFDNPSKACWITGWTRYGSRNELLQVDVSLTSNKLCNISYPRKVDDSMICTSKGQEGVGDCKGVGGGPLVCEFSGKWYLEGPAIKMSTSSCAYTNYTAYAKIRYLKSWIINNITPVSISCDFDHGLCSGWQQLHSDVFDWTRQKGSSLSSNTGPLSDHTSGSGHYMYIETSYPRVAGDNAKLELSVPVNGELSCLKFFYHMYGDTIGTLTVFSGNSVVFTKSGNQGDEWMKAEIDIKLDRTVTFEGVAGSSFTGDLAIDDVSISNGSCFGQTTASPFPLPTSTYAPSLAPLPLSSSPTRTPTLHSLPLTFTFSNSSFSSTSNPVLHSLPSNFTLSTLSFSSTGNPVLHTLESSFGRSSSSISSTRKAASRSLAWTIEPSDSSIMSAQKSASHLPTSTFQPSRPSIFLATTSSPDNHPTVKPSTSQSTLSPQTLLNEGKQEKVMLEIRDLDLNEWDKRMEDDFKRHVARVATDYCHYPEARCQSTSTSSRQRRSSADMAFTGDMVHILPGYPMQSSDDLQIALLAFYLQMPPGFSGNVVRRDVVKSIVNSNMSSIGGSIDGTILRVYLPDVITDSNQDETEDEGNDDESKPTSAIIGTSVGGVLFLVIIAALVLVFRRHIKRRNRLQSQERTNDVVAFKCSTDNAYVKFNQFEANEVASDSTDAAILRLQETAARTNSEISKATKISSDTRV